MRPMFSFFGSKWSLAPRYPPPLDGLPVIEPFAGGACYSLRHNVREAILVEKDPKIATLWRYLIAAKPEEIRALPLAFSGDIGALGLSGGAELLIGFWLNKASTHPARVMRSSSFGARGGWDEARRSRVAHQAAKIKGWRVIEGDYTAAPNTRATWHIDPPYQIAGKWYRHGSGAIDFARLAAWCRSRRGRVMVCENAAADWLPFAPLATVKGTTHNAGGGRVSREVVWYKEGSRAQASLF